MMGLIYYFHFHKNQAQRRNKKFKQNRWNWPIIFGRNSTSASLEHAASIFSNYRSIYQSTRRHTLVEWNLHINYHENLKSNANISFVNINILSLSFLKWICITSRSQCNDGLLTGRPGFDSRHRQDIFLYSRASRPVLGSVSPPIQWEPETLSTRDKQLGREADHSLSSSAEIKNGGAIPSLPQTSSWLN
jgi:hypothetical protein